MKRFILNIVIFGFALLSFLIIFDAAITCAFHRNLTRQYAVWNDILHKDLDADVLIMGNSRAWCQYSPMILDTILGVNSYNLGLDGSCFDRQIARYDIYRHYQPTKPKYIIQNVEYATIGKTIGYEREQFMPYLMYPYFRNRIREVERFSRKELFIPMYRYYATNFYQNLVHKDDILYKGYNSENTPWDGSALRNMTPFEQEVDTNTLSMFIDYIESTRRDSVNLILVIAPLYTDIHSVVLNMDEIHRIYYDLADQFDIPILDYSDCFLSQDTTCFYNATHLNKKGSELFTLRLAHDLDSLGIIRSEGLKVEQMKE